MRRRGLVGRRKDVEWFWVLWEEWTSEQSTMVALRSWSLPITQNTGWTVLLDLVKSLWISASSPRVDFESRATWWRNEIIALIIQLALLTATSRNLLEYIEYFQAKMNSIWNEKACFARAGRKCRHGYKITFKDCQRFQRLREKTQRTLIVLDSCAAVVVKGCCALCQMLDVLDGGNGGRIALWNIGSYFLQIQCYRSKAVC